MKRLAARTLILVLLASGLAVAGENRPGRVALPAINIEKSGKCVAPVDEMRRNHMKMLLHQRDQTMHQGIRGTPHSLKGCIDCHAGSRTNSVLGKDGFCSSCHAYAAVSIDCFECHSPLRQVRAAGAPR
jgi:hypothetical protein